MIEDIEYLENENIKVYSKTKGYKYTKEKLNKISLEINTNTNKTATLRNKQGNIEIFSKILYLTNLKTLLYLFTERFFSS